MREFIIKSWKPVPRNEQETVITYDKYLDEWTIFTDNPVHARKWEHLIEPSLVYPSYKAYHETTGELIGLEGAVNGNVSLAKKRVMNDAQKAKLAQQLEDARAAKMA